MMKSFTRWMIAAFTSLANNPHKQQSLCRRIRQRQRRRLRLHQSHQRRSQSAAIVGTMTTRSVALEEYLRETLDVIDPSYALPLHRQLTKTMMRALLGIPTKTEFEKRLGEFATARRYAAARDFVTDHWPGLQAAVSADKAPAFHQISIATTTTSSAEAALDKLRQFAQVPHKFFRLAARGRVYQGRFDRLLRDVRPDLEAAYGAIFGGGDDDDGDDNASLAGGDLLRQFARRQAVNEDDDDLYQDLVACVDFDYPSSGQWQRPDGGKSSGQRGEAELTDYLEQSIASMHEDDDDSASSSFQILSPVYLRVRNNAKSTSKKCDNVIELPASVDLYGMTGELDALVVRIHSAKEDDDEDDEDTSLSTVSIVQAWEAKATLNIASIQDALTKKRHTLATIMKHAHDCEMIIGSERYKIRHCNDADDADDDESPALPRLGIFGSSLSSPYSAARQIQVVVGEEMLGTEPDFVRQVLYAGNVSVPLERVQGAIERLLEIARQVKPIAIVSSAVELEKAE